MSIIIIMVYLIWQQQLDWRQKVHRPTYYIQSRKTRKCSPVFSRTEEFQCITTGTVQYIKYNQQLYSIIAMWYKSFFLNSSVFTVSHLNVFGWRNLFVIPGSFFRQQIIETRNLRQNSPTKESFCQVFTPSCQCVHTSDDQTCTCSIINAARKHNVHCQCIFFDLLLLVFCHWQVVWLSIPFCSVFYRPLQLLVIHFVLFFNQSTL